MKRIFKTAVLSVLFLILSGITAFAGDSWVLENGNWYCYDADGELMYYKVTVRELPIDD